MMMIGEVFSVNHCTNTQLSTTQLNLRLIDQW